MDFLFFEFFSLAIDRGGMAVEDGSSRGAHVAESFARSTQKTL
jgi:hypothetical protein